MIVSASLDASWTMLHAQVQIYIYSSPYRRQFQHPATHVCFSGLDKVTRSPCASSFSLHYWQLSQLPS